MVTVVELTVVAGAFVALLYALQLWVEREAARESLRQRLAEVRADRTQDEEPLFV